MIERCQRSVRARKIVVLMALVAVISAGVLIARGTRKEAERAEAETVSAIKKLGLIRGNMVRSSVPLMVELTLRHSRDPEGDYQKQFEAGMARLVELGVLEKRKFPLRQNNVRAMMNKTALSSYSRDVLWDLAFNGDETVTVTAKPSEMPRWKELFDAYERDAVTTNVPAGDGL